MMLIVTSLKLIEVSGHPFIQTFYFTRTEAYSGLSGAFLRGFLRRKNRQTYDKPKIKLCIHMFTIEICGRGYMTTKPGLQIRHRWRTQNFVVERPKTQIFSSCIFWSLRPSKIYFIINVQQINFKCIFCM